MELPHEYTCKQVLRLRRYEEKSIKNRRFEGTGSVWPKISGTKGHPLPTILRVRKLDESVFHTV